MQRSDRNVITTAARPAEKPVPQPDLLKGFPFEPALWNIVVEPLNPRAYSDGGIAAAEESMTAESFQVTVGRIIAVGPAALDGTTTGGVRLSNFTAGIQCAADLLGKYCMWQQHTGQEMVLRKTRQRLRCLKATEVLGITNDPSAWKFYI